MSADWKLDAGRYKGHSGGDWEYVPAKSGTELFGFRIMVDGKRHSIANAAVYETDTLILAPDYRSAPFAREFYTPEEAEANGRLLADSKHLLAECLRLQAECALLRGTLVELVTINDDKSLPDNDEEYCAWIDRDERAWKAARAALSEKQGD